MNLIEYFKGLMKGRGGGRLNQVARFEMFNAYAPQFRSWGGRVYESDLVRQSVEAHAKHVGKLKPVISGSAKSRLRAELISGPNEFDIWPQFLERCSNIYRTQNNLFISPILDEFDEIRGFWPLFPADTEVRVKDDVPYLVFAFDSGKEMAMELSRIALVKRFQLKSDFFGEDNGALNETMEMNTMTAQGIIEGIRNASGYQFMAELAQTLFESDVQKTRKQFDEMNFGVKGGKGLLLFNGNLKNVKQLEPGKLPVDAKQMEMIEKRVYRYFGTNEELLQNTADLQKQNTFYENEVEPFAVKLSEALTRMCFSQREQKAGNKIMFASNRLQYMSTSDRISLAKELGDRGAIKIDEIRELFNYPPLENGKGQHAPIRGEYHYAGEEKKDAAEDDKEE